jgi:hypothetical protein
VAAAIDAETFSGAPLGPDGRARVEQMLGNVEATARARSKL